MRLLCFPGSDRMQNAAIEILIHFPSNFLLNPHTFDKRDNIFSLCI